MTRFGVFDQVEQPGRSTLQELYASRLELVELADELGFWGYHKSEHHLIPLDHAPCIGLFLAAAAQRTSTIRICSLVHLLPFYHPLRLLEEVCMLDHLSDGRFELGFGKGVSAPEHILWGLDPDEAVARTDETLDLLLQALQWPEGELFDFEGRFHQLAGVPLEVRPLQRPFPPLWRPGQVAAAASLGVSTVVGGPIPVVHQAVEQYHQLRQSTLSGGREPTIGAIRKFIVAPTDAEADTIGRRSWPTFTRNLRVLFERYEMETPNDPTVGGDYDLARERNVIVVGSPETVRSHVEELMAGGVVEYIIGQFAFGDLAHEEARRSMELFGRHVVAPLGA